MKCRVKEKIASQNRQTLIQAYGNIFYDYLNKSMLLALAEEFGFRGKRLEKMVSVLPTKTTKELERYEPAEMKVQTKNGLKNGTEANRIMDAIMTLAEVNLKQLKDDIEYLPDFGTDFDYTSLKYCTKAVSNRQIWYGSSGYYIAICYASQFMLLLNELYGFGAGRLDKWYKAFIILYKKWVDNFIGESADKDDNILKVRDEVDDRLSAVGLSVVTNIFQGDTVNVTNF